jgi:hypothetical protein
MALTSNSFTLTITAAASSAIATAAASLSSGQWGTVTVSNQLNCDPNGSGDSMFSFSPQMTVDTTNNVLHFWGGVHGAPSSMQRMHHGFYTESSNSWATVSTPPSLPSGTGGAHAYYGGTVDQQTGDFYGCAPFYGVATTYKRTRSTGLWSTPLPAVPDDASSATCATLVYHPGLYGGQGGLIHASQRGVWTLNLRAGSPSWTRIISTFPAMAQFQAGVYDYKTAAAYVGGADGDGGNLYRINAHAGAGSATTVAQPAMGLNTSSGTRILVAAGNPANNMVVLDRSGNAEQWNGTSWSSFASGHPAASYASGDAPGWSAGGAWPRAVAADGFIVFSRGVRVGGAPRTSTTMDIWKR